MSEQPAPYLRIIVTREDGCEPWLVGRESAVRVNGRARKTCRRRGARSARVIPASCEGKRPCCRSPMHA